MRKVLSSKLDDIMKALDEGLEGFVNSDNFKRYLKTLSAFHTYSSRNVMLISMQMPEAQLVAGFNTWKNKFHRYVKKGEKGIKIIPPL